MLNWFAHAVCKLLIVRLLVLWFAFVLLPLVVKDPHETTQTGVITAILIIPTVAPNYFQKCFLFS